MRSDRRTFLKRLGALALAFSCNPFEAASKSLGEEKKSPRHVTILHTNDVHSHIDPIEIDSVTHTTVGGYARRKTYIDTVRNEVSDILIFECGDMFQGTPYFNMYKGKLEIELMNKMGIDAVTLGNHEFDNGLEELTQRVKEAQFDFLNANYDFKGHELASLVKPYKIYERGGIKIGVLGLGVELEGLVSYSNYGATIYNDPIERANEIAAILHDEGCELIIAITHLGYEMRTLPDDITLARNSKHIDLILGGHTHTLLHQPTIVTNLSGKSVLINQVGYGGINMGRIDVTIDTDDSLSMLSHNAMLMN